MQFNVTSRLDMYSFGGPIVTVRQLVGITRLKVSSHSKIDGSSPSSAVSACTKCALSCYVGNFPCWTGSAS